MPTKQKVSGSSPLGRAINSPNKAVRMVAKHEHYMHEALKQARLASESDEVPVGAVVVYKNQIIARAYNQTRTLKDPTAHAEMIAITQAASFVHNERLNGCDMYVTIEPCPMCAGAMVLARIRNLYYATKDPKSGAAGSVTNILNNRRLNHRVKVKSGILQKEACFLIQDFFREKRGRSTQAAEGAGLLSL